MSPDALVGLGRARSYLAVGKAMPFQRKVKGKYETRLRIRPALGYLEAWEWVAADGDTDNEGAFVALHTECRAWQFRTVGQVERSLGVRGVIEMIDRVLTGAALD